MKKADPMKHQKQHDKMIQDIADYFAERFRADPSIDEIRFPAIRQVICALREARVSLWTYTDTGLAQKIAAALYAGGPLLGYVTRRESMNLQGERGHIEEWVFTRKKIYAS